MNRCIAYQKRKDSIRFCAFILLLFFRFFKFLKTTISLNLTYAQHFLLFEKKMKGFGGIRKALVIGISDYNHLPSLHFCKNDGETIFKILNSLNYKIFDTLIGYGSSKRGHISCIR
jgi:Caspase domain